MVLSIAKDKGDEGLSSHLYLGLIFMMLGMYAFCNVSRSGTGKEQGMSIHSLISFIKESRSLDNPFVLESN